MDQLNDLIDSVIATEQFPTAWAWQANPDDYDSDYMDCSTNTATGFHTWEMGGTDKDSGERINVQLELTVDQLREIHRKLTLQLAVITRQNA